MGPMSPMSPMSPMRLAGAGPQPHGVRGMSTASDGAVYGGDAAAAGPAAPRRKMTIPRLSLKQRKGEKITMLTAYDYPTARVMDAEGVDVILVGDSLGMVVLGYDSTTPVDMAEMIHHTKAVARGTEGALIVGDLPFGSYLTPAAAAENAVRMLKEGGADCVKLEGGVRVCDQVEAIVAGGIPVMGHIGLTPQTHSQLGGYGVQGKTAASAAALVADAEALQEAGCFSIVLECVPTQVADYITQRLRIPTIGIGSGNATAGQVLVSHDVFGLFDAPPRLSKRYGNSRATMQSAVQAYMRDVTDNGFPGMDHAVKMKPRQHDDFLRRVGTHGADRADLTSFAGKRYASASDAAAGTAGAASGASEASEAAAAHLNAGTAALAAQAQAHWGSSVRPVGLLSTKYGLPTGGWSAGVQAQQQQQQHAGMSSSSAATAAAVSPSEVSRPLRKVVVVGGGAMGSLVASKLSALAGGAAGGAAGGLDLWMLSSWEDHVGAIEARGGAIDLTPLVDAGVGMSTDMVEGETAHRGMAVRATTSAEAVVECGVQADLVIIATKGGESAVRAAEVARDILLAPGAPVLTVQNGVNGANLAAVVGADRVICGVTSHGATMLGPGAVRHAGEGPTYLAPFTQSAELAQRAEAVAALLSRAGLETTALEAQELEPMVWRKLLVNAVINPVTALVGRPNDCVTDPALAPLVDSIIAEVVSVANAMGVALPGDPKGEVMRVARATGSNVSSMLADVKRGVPTEVSTINGFIVQEACKFGVPVPVNQNLALMLQARTGGGVQL